MSSIPGLTSVDNGSLFYGPSFIAVSLYGLKPDGPFADKKIRQALNLIVDRAAISETVFKGAARPSRTLVPRAIWETSYPKEATKVFEEAYDELPAMDSPDMERARQLVEESGKKGETIVLATLAGSPESTQTATLIQAAAKEIGLNIEINKMNPTDHSSLYYSEAVRKKSGADIGLINDFFDIADPLDLLTFWVVTDGFFNQLGYSDPRVDKAITAARSSLDRTESARQIVKAQKIYTEDAINVPIASPHSVTFLNEKITGAPASFAFLFTPWAAALGSPK